MLGNPRAWGWRWRRRLSLLAIAVVVLVGALQGIRTATAAHGPVLLQPLAAADMQQLIFIWASGTPAVQTLAQQDCAQLRLYATDCAAISTAVRSAWLALMQRDPAALGRVGVAQQPAGSRGVLAALATRLAMATHNRVFPLLTVTHTSFATTRDPRWQRQAALVYGKPIIGKLTNTKLVWATAYLQTALPAGMDPYASQYLALPDNYLKYANWGMISAIPTIYQPFYAPLGVTTHWAVTVTTADGRHVASQVPITDVGPWNEDDNWWDANGTSTTLPASCPVATTLVASDATSNPLVDGICPNGANLRRLYYYLLYQHAGLPFFQNSSYAPSGTFHDGTTWPVALPQFCAETVVAAINNDGATCSSLTGYNGTNGSWLRENSYDGPVLNQSSIDLSPAVDAAFGWTYPSSGLVQVAVGTLP